MFGNIRMNCILIVSGARLELTHDVNVILTERISLFHI